MIDHRTRNIYVIAGPTATGKTALGVRLANHFNGEVINSDSVQVYQGVKIATAKPTEQEMEGVTHHLIDYVDPNIKYTAAEWASDAAQKIAEIESRERVAVLVGGTGFYLRSLMHPLFDSPKTDQALRKRLRSIHDRRSAGHLHKLLYRVDPAAAAKLPPRDHVRIIRALEVYFQTGIPLSAQQTHRPARPEFASRIRFIVLSPPRDELYARINNRTEMHFAGGLVDEVRQLLSAGVSEKGNALGAHGYRRVCEFLRGERSLESAIEKTKQDVRNYAKRQLTWFRREPGAIWFNGFGDDSDVQAAIIDSLSPKN